MELKFDILYRELANEYPNILTESIESAVQFKTIAAQLNKHKEEIFSHFGLTSGRFHLLMLLKVEPTKSLSPSELAKRSGVTRATMTQFIDALEKSGFVERAIDPKDRRGMLVKLTSTGAEKIAQVMPHYIERLSSFCHVLTREERGQFQGLMKKIHLSLDKSKTPLPH